MASNRKMAEIWYDTTRDESRRFEVIHELSGARGYGRDPESALVDMRPKACELVHRLSAGNPQAEKVQISEECRCCGEAAARYMGSPYATCDYCADHCRAPGPVDKNWYHGVITEPERSDGRIRCNGGMSSTSHDYKLCSGGQWCDSRKTGEHCAICNGDRPPQAQRSADRIEAGSEQEVVSPGGEMSSAFDYRTGDEG